jgi:hypothetical protein
MEKKPGRTRSYWGHELLPNDHERGTMSDTAVRKFGSRVVRDYIPAGKERTPEELERSKQLKAMGAGRVRMDFIPPAGHELKPPSGRADQASEALARSMARQASAARQDFQTGVERLQKLNVGQAVEAILQAPFSVQEMLLVAEKLNGNRVSVLNRFPQVDPATVARWGEINAGSPDPGVSGATNEASKGTAEALPTDAKE